MDNSLLEVRKLLKQAISKGKWVQEVVCDYVLDMNRTPVLLNCEGFIVGTTKRTRVQVISPVLEPNPLRSICEPTGTPDLASQHETSNFPIRASTEIPQSRSRMRRFPALSAAPPSPEVLHLSELLSKEVSCYEEIRARVSAYRQEQRDSINYVRKYGGTEFWRPVLERVAVIFKADSVLKQYYDHLNFEEGHMLLRGYERILEGNFSIYYKKSMTLIHTGKGISAVAFQAFVSNVGAVLGEFAIMKQDCELIVARFRSLESYICPRHDTSISGS